ncbi:MAG TPA: peptidylprolyl isomerase [Gammaproteobacteria bacterium]|nr:peptidylprolyl isomerase [Gammaproteobacteria bacterium]
MRKALAVGLVALASTAAVAQEGATVENRQIFISGEARVRIETSIGHFVAALDAARAPETVQNFLQYVVDDHYEGTVFHRVAAGFVVQGGGYTPDLTLKPVQRTVVNESGNGLSNLRGTIAMARGNDPHSADAQFYLNLVDNPSLNPRPTRWGYAVFGEVVEGMEVVDLIGAVPTGAGGEFDRDVPADPIIIERVVLLDDEEDQDE